MLTTMLKARFATRVLRLLLAGLVAAGAGLVAATAGAAKSARQESKRAGAPGATVHMLSNGMKVVLVPRHLTPTVSAGWVAHVGSVNERPGITGISHLFEHMMFKGTHVIGTRDIDKDLRLIDAQEAVREEMRAEETQLRLAQRRGEIADITAPEAKTERTKTLEARFDSLVAEQRANMIKSDYNQIIQKNGGSFINAFTNNDQTFYFWTAPANKLELWFWMESDRLKHRVFREFYSERDVVYEERRLRTESTPTGKFQESLDAVFWDASPYSWPVVGWPTDVANITKAQADAYYDLYYAPQNLTAILVGDFDPQQALDLAERYLGSIPRGRNAVPEVVTAETQQLAEKRFIAEAETNPAVEIRWHVPAFQHKDSPALQVLETVLNGPTGRLKRNLVLDAEVASSAQAGHQPLRYEGMFSMNAEAKEGTPLETLEAGLLGEMEKVQREPVTAEELQRAKNQYLADNYRSLSTNFAVMIRYGIADGLGSWDDFDHLEERIRAVSADDVQRVAKAYFTKENRTVAYWKRKAGAETEDPALAALPPEAQGMVRQMLGTVETADDPAKLQQMLARMEQMGAQVPPEMKPALDYVRSKVLARIETLEKSAPAEAKE